MWFKKYITQLIKEVLMEEKIQSKKRECILDDILEKLRELEKQISMLRAEQGNNALQNNVSKSNGDDVSLQKDAIPISEEIISLKKDLTSAKNMLEEKAKELAFANDRLDEKDKQLGEKDKQLGEKSRELSSAKNKLSEKDKELEELQRKLSDASHTLEKFKASQGPYVEHYEKFKSLPIDIKSNLSGILRGETSEQFIFSGMQEDNLGRLWDFCANEAKRKSECAEVLSQIFWFFFDKCQALHDEPQFLRATVAVGERFDEDYASRDSDSVPLGNIQKIILLGYNRRLGNKTVKKSIVHVGRD